jgi:hypothetical protein
MRVFANPMLCASSVVGAKVWWGDSHTELLDPGRAREWPSRCRLFQQFIKRRVIRVHLRSFNGLEYDIR